MTFTRQLAERINPTSRGEHHNRWPTPGALALDLDRHKINTAALELIDRHLVAVANGETERLIISMPPQEGKSERVSRAFVLWTLCRNPDTRIAVVSFQFGMARRWGRAVRNDAITHNLFAIDPSQAAANEWMIDGHIGGMYTVGIGGALTGRPVDLLVIDDPLRGRKDASSETTREDAWDWWTSTALSRLAPGAPVVMVLTRWHEDDLAGRFLAEGGWEYLNIPAQADHHPERGETDPLGRRPGEWLDSARRRTPQQWEQRKAATPPRDWISLYQGRPSPDDGDVFKRDWWRRYPTPIWTVHDDGTYRVPDTWRLMQSWDMAFKDTKSSDYVVGQVWAWQGSRAWLVDQIRARLTFTQTVAAVRRLTDRWPQAHAKYVEDKANGTAVIDLLAREIGGIIPVTPKESKYARASAISPFVEAGNIWLPEPEAAVPGCDADALVEEAAAFPNGTHDDMVDALSQAVAKMNLGAKALVPFDDEEPSKALDGSDLLEPVAAGRFAIRPEHTFAAQLAATSALEDRPDSLY